MKTNSLMKRLLSVIAVLMAVVMVFSACGGNNDTTADTSSVDADVDDTTGENNGDADDTSSNEDATSSEEGEDGDDTSSKKTTSKTSSNKTSSNKTSSNKTSTGSTKWNISDITKISANDIPESVRKKEVHVLMWRKYTNSEQKQVDDFQKKTGMKVRTTVTTETQYSTKLISLITAKDSPDVVCLGVRDFPAKVVKSMQPLKKDVFRLDDSIWNKTYMDTMRVGNDYYSVAISGIWSCEDTNYVTTYDPTVLKEIGISTTPYQLYKQGKWNWDAQKAIVAAAVNPSTPNKTGLAQLNNDLYMLSAGVDFVDYNPSKATFTNNLGSVQNGSMLEKSWSAFQELTSIGGTAGWNEDAFCQGKVALFSNIAWSLYNEGDMFDDMKGGYADLESVPIAGPTQSSAYNPVRPKTWGVAKGAKNPEGAAFFLRYYLDPKTIDMDSTFYNSQFKWCFNEITKSSAKKKIMYGSGVVDYVTDGTYASICSALGNGASGSATTTLNKNKGTVNNTINRANKALKKLVDAQK